MYLTFLITLQHTHIHPQHKGEGSVPEILKFALGFYALQSSVPTPPFLSFTAEEHVARVDRTARTLLKRVHKNILRQDFFLFEPMFVAFNCGLVFMIVALVVRCASRCISKIAPKKEHED